MPETMIKKVAEAAALRMAFPEDLSGIYTHAEMQQADVVGEVERTVKEKQPKEEAPKAESTLAGEKPEAGIGKIPKPKRDPATVRSITELYKACNADFGMQPEQILKELNVTSKSEISELPEECYRKVVAVRCE